MLRKMKNLNVKENEKPYNIRYISKEKSKNLNIKENSMR